MTDHLMNEPSSVTTSGAEASEGASGSGADYVDWDFAAATGRLLAPAGPNVSRDEIEELVGDLRQASRSAVLPVAQTSGLHAPQDAPPPLIVDRAGWIEANAVSMKGMLAPVLDHVVAARRKGHEPGAAARKFGGRVTGAEVAGMLAWMSTKVCEP